MDKSSFALVFALFVVCILSVFATPIQKRGAEDDGPPLQQRNPGSKRTFCNAFTGCGRKRSGGGSGGSDGPPRDYPDYSEGEQQPSRGGSADSEDSGATMEDVARDILAEARLWEALNSLRPPQQQRFQQQQQQRNKGNGYRGSMRRQLEEQLPN